MKDSRASDFRKVLFGQSVSVFGSSFTGVVLQLLVDPLTHSPVYLVVSFAASRLLYLVFGLKGGAYTDRVERNSLMIRTDLVNVPPDSVRGLLRSCPRWTRPAQKLFVT
jgi:hypothetical protein